MTDDVTTGGGMSRGEGVWEPTPEGGDYDPDQTMHVSFAAQLPIPGEPGTDPLAAPTRWDAAAVPDPAAQWAIPTVPDDVPDESGEFPMGTAPTPAPWSAAPAADTSATPTRWTAPPAGQWAPPPGDASGQWELPFAAVRGSEDSRETALGAGDDSGQFRAPSTDPAPAPAPAPALEPGPGSGSGSGPGPEAAAPGDPDPDRAPAPGEDLHSEHPLASYVLRVNGADRPVTDAWLGESLLYVLRERLGLAGAKDGCEQGECGSCSVQVDGRLVASCLVPAATAAGCEVRTVEGLSANGQPSDVQRALAESCAVQCGFCIPGLAMTVHDLLEGNHKPTELETRQAICGNLCRCSGYRGVLDAVRGIVASREAAHEGTSGTDGAPDVLRIPHQSTGDPA